MSEFTGRHTLARALKRTIMRDGQPIEEEITEVIVRPVERAKDLFCMDAFEGQFAKTAALIAHLSDLSYEQVENLHPADFKELSKKAEAFL